MTAVVDEDELFETPAPPPRKVHGRYGRYELPDPDTGKGRSWMRATTAAKTLEDTYYLEMWGKRKLLQGVTLDPNIQTMARAAIAEHGMDSQAGKKALDDLGKRAIDRAGAHDGATLGTELHKLTELYHAGELEQIPDALLENVRAYANTMRSEGITVLPQYAERIICIPELDICGRLDNMIQLPGRDDYRVLDLKSQKTMDFGALSVAIQLSLYAHGYAMFNEQTWTWEPMPPMDQDWAMVAHLPVLEGQEEKVCQLYDVDLVEGWRWARAALKVRGARKAKLLKPRPPRTIPLAVGPSLEDELAQARARKGVKVTNSTPALAAVEQLADDLDQLTPAVLADVKMTTSAGRAKLGTTEDYQKFTETLGNLAASANETPVPIKLTTADVMAELAAGRDRAASLATIPAQDGPTVSATAEMPGNGPIGSPQGVDWESKLRETRTIKALMDAGRECTAAGHMTEDLKVLGRNLAAQMAVQPTH